MLKCKQCGAPNPENSTICYSCSSQLKAVNKKLRLFLVLIGTSLLIAVIIAGIQFLIPSRELGITGTYKVESMYGVKLDEADSATGMWIFDGNGKCVINDENNEEDMVATYKIDGDTIIFCPSTDEQVIQMSDMQDSLGASVFTAQLSSDRKSFTFMGTIFVKVE